MDRNPGAQAHHDRMILFMSERLPRLGYHDIQADLEGYELPARIPGLKHSDRPDLFCLNSSGRPVIFEVETCNSWDDKHVIGQWTLFRSAADQLNGEFHIVIPRDCGKNRGCLLVKHTLSILEITADKIWEVEI